MVACPQCQVNNSLDSQFCKGCGANLPADALTEAKRALDELVSIGYKALNEGRVDEAALIAESALEQSPESVPALSLKGMALERKGDLAGALAAYERSLELNPNSALDKIKIQQLRNSLSAQLLHSSEPAPRGRAMLAAMAAVVLVASIGVAAATFANRGAPESGSGRVAQNEPNRGALDGNPLNSTKVETKSGANGADGAPNAGAGTPEKPVTQGGNRSNPNDPNYVEPIKSSPRNGGSSSNPNLTLGAGTNANGGLPKISGNSGWQPLQPTGPIGVESTKPNPPPTQNGGRSDEIDPKMGGGNGGKPINNGSGATTNPGDNGDPGTIEIKTSRRNPNGSSGGGQDANHADPSSVSLREAAKQQFQLGKYDQAARSYERLLEQGGESASVLQRLGQCYQQLGRNGDAISAYRRAAALLESRAKSGNDSVAQAQLQSCLSAIKVLGG